MLLKQVIKALLEQDMEPRRLFLVPCDALPGLHNVTEPILELTRWFAATVLKKSLNQAAHDGEQAYIFFADLHTLSYWAPQLKHLVDLQPVRVLATSSVALNHETGRTSFAGRMGTVKLGSL
jgi:predicted AAA+ superfamily ATPase